MWLVETTVVMLVDVGSLAVKVGVVMMVLMMMMTSMCILVGTSVIGSMIFHGANG